MSADRPHGADNDQQDEVAAVAPPSKEAGEERKEGDCVGCEERGDALGEPDSGVGPRTKAVSAVEIPVAQPPKDLG